MSEKKKYVVECKWKTIGQEWERSTTAPGTFFNADDAFAVAEKAESMAPGYAYRVVEVVHVPVKRPLKWEEGKTYRGHVSKQEYEAVKVFADGSAVIVRGDNFVNSASLIRDRADRANYEEI